MSLTSLDDSNIKTFLTYLSQFWIISATSTPEITSILTDFSFELSDKEKAELFFRARNTRDTINYQQPAIINFGELALIFGVYINLTKN
jgi:hypothetical protein